MTKQVLVLGTVFGIFSVLHVLATFEGPDQNTECFQLVLKFCSITIDVLLISKGFKSARRFAHCLVSAPCYTGPLAACMRVHSLPPSLCTWGMTEGSVSRTMHSDISLRTALCRCALQLQYNTQMNHLILRCHRPCRLGSQSTGGFMLGVNARRSPDQLIYAKLQCQTVLGVRFSFGS